MKIKINEKHNYFNMNPNDQTIGDCSARAISLAYDIPYEDIVKTFGKSTGVETSVVFNTIQKLGYIDSGGFPDIVMNVQKFCEKYKDGTYIITCIDLSDDQFHAVCCINGTYFDTWDCKDCLVLVYFLIKKGENKNELTEESYTYIVNKFCQLVKEGTKLISETLGEELIDTYEHKKFHGNNSIEITIKIFIKFCALECVF